MIGDFTNDDNPNLYAYQAQNIDKKHRKYIINIMQQYDKDFDTAWNKIKNTAAQMVSWYPAPAQATIKPKFEIVEYANTFLPSLCEIARQDATKNVNPPQRYTICPT